jgi:hypothetical protein
MTVFNEDGTIDTFTVGPGTYVITAIGATGGGLGVAGYEGGAGAEVVGTFTFATTTTLEILVGGAGTSNAGGSPNGSGSGGGGSFVYDETTGTLLEAAGGGGGASAGSGGTGSPGGDGGEGQAGTSGEAGGNYYNGLGESPGGAGGTDGSGGAAGHFATGAAGSDSGGGGGGFNSATSPNGDGDGGNGDYGQGGLSFLDGGTGGAGANLNNALNGGFGGGGGAASDGIGGGGGGGYSGGGGGEFNVGGGGGSYISSSAYSTTIIAGENSLGNGTVTITPCFLAGTLIATPEGETPVENLAIGDMIRTASGAVRPIVWIGHGRVLATRGRRNAATPVIVGKGALGPGVPHQDLRVTKGHSFFVDGVLIPVEFLVNHRSIRWDDQAQEVVHFHIELDTHDVLLANGAPAETYRDDGNRWLFQNANSGWHLPPKPPCAPVLTGGPVVDTVWRRLAGPVPCLPTTTDPDLHLLVDGRRMDATWVCGALHHFRLPARPRTVRIVSRAGVPQELGTARDPRRLGVALRQIIVTQGDQVRRVPPASALLTEGFHDYEPDDAIRWTDGDAVVPASLFDGCAGSLELALHLGGATSYLAERDLLRVA